MFVDTTPTGNPGLESSDVESFENKKTSYRIIVTHAITPIIQQSNHTN